MRFKVKIERPFIDDGKVVNYRQYSTASKMTDFIQRCIEEKVKAQFTLYIDGYKLQEFSIL